MKISFPEKEVAEFEADCAAAADQGALLLDSGIDEASFSKFVERHNDCHAIAAFMLRRYIKTGSVFDKED